MKTIEQIYEPYNFSSTRCFVIKLDVGTNGFLKIEYKIPSYVRKLKGIFVTVRGASQYKSLQSEAGFISLNFNGQALKCFQSAVPQSLYLYDCSKPIPFDEDIKPNSFMQGYYQNNALNPPSKIGLTVSIYLHFSHGL